MTQKCMSVLYWFLFVDFTIEYTTVLNITSVNSGDGIDYHQRFGENIGDLIQVTPLKSHTLKGQCHKICYIRFFLMSFTSVSDNSIFDFKKLKNLKSLKISIYLLTCVSWQRQQWSELCVIDSVYLIYEYLGMSLIFEYIVIRKKEA